jgi:hypothetical protein
VWQALCGGARLPPRDQGLDPVSELALLLHEALDRRRSTCLMDALRVGSTGHQWHLRRCLAASVRYPLRSRSLVRRLVDVSETAVVGIAGIIAGVVGALGGVVIGRWLEAGQADRELRRRTYHEYAAILLEQIHQNDELNDRIARFGIDARDSGDIIRPDFTPAFYRAVAMVEIVAEGEVRRHVVMVGEALGAVVDAVMGDRATFDAAGTAALEAVHAFQRAARSDLMPGNRKAMMKLRAAFVTRRRKQ